MVNMKIAFWALFCLLIAVSQGKYAWQKLILTSMFRSHFLKLILR